MLDQPSDSLGSSSVIAVGEEGKLPLTRQKLWYGEPVPIPARQLVAKRANVLLAWVCLVAPAAIAFNYIFRFGIDVPYWDQWEFVPLLGEVFEGRLPFRLLAAQANEHRILLPRVLMLLLAGLTRYNTLAEMYASWLMLCAMVAILFRVYAKSFGLSLWSLAKFIPVSWLVLTLRQRENLLWGWQVVIVLACLLLFATLYLIQSAAEHPRGLALAIIAAAGCTFSFGAGLLVWPVGLAQLLWMRAHRRGAASGGAGIILAWILGSAICVGLFLWGYHRPGEDMPLSRVLRRPFLLLSSLSMAVGNPLADGPLNAQILGGIVLLLFLAVAVLHARGGIDLEKAPLSLPLILWTLLAALLVTLGRVDVDPAAALYSRYVTLMVPGLVGCYLAVLAIRNRGTRIVLGVAWASWR